MFFLIFFSKSRGGGPPPPFWDLGGAAAPPPPPPISASDSEVKIFPLSHFIWQKNIVNHKNYSKWQKFSVENYILLVVWIQIRHFLQIWIQVPKILRIQAHPDPKHCLPLHLYRPRGENRNFWKVGWSPRKWGGVVAEFSKKNWGGVQFELHRRWIGVKLWKICVSLCFFQNLGGAVPPSFWDLGGGRLPLRPPLFPPLKFDP